MVEPMKIKRIKEKHLESLRKIRNANREWFFNKDIISQESQLSWYKSIKDNAKIKFYIIEIDEEVAGSLSLTKTKSGIEIGNILLDDRFRGKGIMTEAIKKIIKNKNKKFYARIILENTASQNLFERCGFVKSAYILELNVKNI